MPKLNSLVADLSLPRVPSVLAWARAYEGGRGPLIDLSQAVPGYPAHPDMFAWLSDFAGQRAYMSYGAIEGEDVLREEYATHVSELYGAEITAANIHITAGANQAFMCLAMALAGTGDTIALTEPYYFNQQSTLAMLGIGIKTIACDPDNSFLPVMADLERVLESGVRALSLVTPCNPTGAVYPPDMLSEIYRLCRKHDCWLILDETYRDFLPDTSEPPHRLLSEPDWQDGLVVAYSFSKSYCIPGHRMGAITASAKVVEQVAKIMDNLQICAPRSPQAALARAIPALKDWREANRAEIATRAAALKDVMSRLNDWNIAAIGAYFAYVRHPFADIGSEAVAKSLALDAGVACLPGAYFGEGQERYLRFAFANCDAPTIRMLEERLRGFRVG